MDFSEKIAELTKKVRNIGDTLGTEEATKNALVMPFIAALGYDVFNPGEVVPEFSAPIGEYKDARVDYAILADGKPILLIECKAFGTALDTKQCNQLQLYFHGTEAPESLPADLPEEAQEKPVASNIVTTEEEREAFYLVKSLLMGVVDAERIKLQDWQAYCNIVLDGRFKPLLRLHFNKRPWSVGLFDGENKDAKVQIDKLDDILPLGDRIRATAVQYDAAKKAKEGE